MQEKRPRKIIEKIKYSLNIYLAVTFLSVVYANAQESVLVQTVLFTYNEELIVKMNISQGYKELEFNYEEGVGIIYGWEGGEIVQLVKGAMFIPPISADDSILCKYEDSQKFTIKGFNKRNNNYWRHDRYKHIKGLNISYLNVKSLDTVKFESVLNKVEFSKLE